MAIFDTAATVISHAARELGLVSADIANPYSSTGNRHILHLTTLLTTAGKEIVREHLWSQHLATHSFNTVAGTSVYDLPADFLRMVNQAGWNRTSRFPLGGPLSPQQWEFLTALGSGVVFRLVFRPRNRKLEFVNGTSTPGSQTVAFEYLSSYWVQANGQSTGTKAAPTAANDTILFDTHLITRALIYHFRKTKGFDASVAEADYRKALDAVMRDDTPAPVLSLNGPHPTSGAIGDVNVPITGFGA